MKLRILKYIELKHYCPRIMVLEGWENNKPPDIDQIPEYLIQAEVEECLLCSINLVNLFRIRKTFMKLKEYIAINSYMCVNK